MKIYIKSRTEQDNENISELRALRYMCIMIPLWYLCVKMKLIELLSLYCSRKCRWKKSSYENLKSMKYTLLNKSGNPENVKK